MKRLFEFFLTALLAVCCTDKVLEPDDGTPATPPAETDMIILGDQLEDPYSVGNMTKALAALYPTKAAGRVPVPTTHYYVRFLPQNERQFNELERLGIELQDHPLDYEIVRDGDWYHDPEIPDGEITWQYAVVPSDMALPRLIRYEILDACYIPSAEMPTKSADGIDWVAVERASFELTGNGAMLEEAPTKGAPVEYKPAGRITILDPARGEAEGVRGVRVACNVFVKTGYAFTDEDGRYQMTLSFTGKPRYRLMFKNSAGFNIGFNLLLVPASVSTLGVGEATGLDAQVDRNSDRKLFSRCVVNNAGYDYIHRCGETSPSVKAPPSNLRFWLFQGLDVSCTAMLQQGAIIDNGQIGRLLGIYSILLKIFLPDVILGLKGLDDYDEIYAEAVHAFAHASHFMQAGKDFWDHYVRFLVKSFITSGFTVYGTGAEEDHGYCEVGEMWAHFFQTVLYRERYGSLNGRQFGRGHWFRPEVLIQLEEQGLDANRIFQVLESDVTDREMLQKKLTSYYPEYKAAINEAFALYK
ncbi:MAG: hypothetical protein IKP15_01450 [Bacteroidales bacterium]|nr:hypothetical protein [Bacteroidales bacterium]